MSKYTLLEKSPLDVSSKNEIGHMRVDFASGDMVKTWYPIPKLFHALPIDQKNEATTFCDTLLRETFPTFDHIVRQCGGEGYGYELRLFAQNASFNYAIQLIPVKEDYALYVYVYAK